MKKNKVALIGNMNNNNFSIMRYFRDLGIDAHLFLFANDGVEGLSHFIPENDTWDYEKWKPYIHYVDFNIDQVSVQENSFFIKIFYLLLRIRLVIKNGHLTKNYKSVSNSKIENTFKDYNCFIGSGLSGALLSRIGRRLDIFYPYATGIEYLGSMPTRLDIVQKNPIKRYMAKSLAQTQEAAIRNARICINGEMSLTKKTFNEIGVEFISINIPMVYNQENISDNTLLSKKVLKIREEIQSCDFALFNHSRQLWKQKDEYSKREWESRSKHNEWLFRSIAGLKKKRPKLNFKLFVLEYGEDVNESKNFCIELGIDDRVVWLPKMPRKELMLLLTYCQIGVGEFYTDSNVVWGGTGWEILASGKPLLQGFNFRDGEFEKNFGHKPPPMLQVEKETDILEHLIKICDNPEIGVDIGKRAKEWFDCYGGIGLANKWLKLLTS